MGVKEYELPNGRKAVFEFDENGVGKITLEAMDVLMELINIDLVKCEECEWSNGECSVGERYQGGCTFGERRADGDI